MRRPMLPKGKRIAAARLSGTVGALHGRFKDLSRDAKLDELWAVTQDPAVLGDQLGVALANDDAEAVELLRDLRADETVAAGVAEWIRWKRARDAAAPGPVL